MIPTIEVPKPPVDLSVIPPEHRTRFLNPGEIEILCSLIGSVNPHRVAEFGCQNGRTARVILHNVPGIERYIGMDVPPDYVTACEVQRKEVPQRPGELALEDDRFTVLITKKGSHALKPEDLGPLDAVFIDGDHSVEGVMNDYRLAKECVRPGGVIIFHDYHDLGTVGVKEALHTLKDQGADIWHVPSSWICFERVG